MDHWFRDRYKFLLVALAVGVILTEYWRWAF
jgi:hypothetical protein